VDTVANNGAGKVQIDGAGLRAGATLQFCPIGGNLQNCFNLPITAGSGATNFQIPVNSALAGVFVVHDPVDGQVFQSGFGTTAGESFQSALLPASSIAGGIGETTGNAPLMSGSVTVSGSTLHLVLNGTTPNQSFSVSGCIPASSLCPPFGNVVSNADGSLTADLPEPLISFGIIVVRDSAGAEFISGFRLM
jgi:hypothetical protein